MLPTVQAVPKTPLSTTSKVGIISDSHKISDSIPRICQNDASKLVGKSRSITSRTARRENGARKARERRENGAKTARERRKNGARTARER
jgi:hypothetical protein